MTVAHVCERCNTQFESKATTARFCGAACRNKAHREAKRGVATAPDAVASGVATDADGDATLIGLTQRELAAIGQADTAAGALALLLASRIVLYPLHESATGFAALAKSYRAAMAEAAAQTEEGDDDDDLGIDLSDGGLRLVQGGHS